MCGSLLESQWSKEISIRHQSKVWLAKYWSFILQNTASNAALVNGGEPCHLFWCKAYLIEKNGLRQPRCPSLTRVSDLLTQHGFVCSASCRAQSANEVPASQGEGGCQPVSRKMGVLWKGYPQLRNSSSSFQSPVALPHLPTDCGVSFTALFVALFLWGACSLLWAARTGYLWPQP